MIKKTITYENFDGELITHEAWFHAYKTVLIEITEKIEQLTETEQQDKAFQIMKDILVKTYGQRVGELFVQTEEVVDMLRYTNMLDQLVLDLISSPTEMVNFMVGIMPADVNKNLRTTPEGIKTINDVTAKMNELYDLDEEQADVTTEDSE